jgi:hypothetical protein
LPAPAKQEIRIPASSGDDVSSFNPCARAASLLIEAMASSAMSGLKHESCPTSLVQSEIHLLMEAEMLPSGTISL